MEELLKLLRDGHSRSVELLALELRTSTEDILRRMEFLERAGMIRRVLNTGSGCGGSSCTSGSSCAGSCSGCGGSASGASGKKTCSDCLPDGGFKHMGEMWEVVN